MFNEYIPYAGAALVIGVCAYTFILKYDNLYLTDENKRLSTENASLLSLNDRNDKVCRRTIEDYDQRIAEVITALEEERTAHNRVKLLANEVELRRVEKTEGVYNCSISHDATDPVLRRLNND